MAAASVGPAAASAGPAAAAAPPEEAPQEATQPAEATPAEEVLRQSSAIVSADPELNRVVAAMQPAAGQPTAPDTWLLQLGAVLGAFIAVVAAGLLAAGCCCDECGVTWTCGRRRRWSDHWE